MGTIFEVIAEIIFEFFIEGSIEMATAGKGPLWLRILLLSVIALLYGGLIYIALSIAITKKSFAALICAIVITAIIVLFFRSKYKEYRLRKNKA